MYNGNINNSSTPLVWNIRENISVLTPNTYEPSEVKKQ